MTAPGQGQQGPHQGSHLTPVVEADKPIRTAIVVGGADSLQHLQSYLPANYEAREFYVNVAPLTKRQFGNVYVITGKDVAGWTLDGYVIPRLGSGLIAAQEVEPI